MTTGEVERYVTQLRLWRGVVNDLSEVSRRALREALAEAKTGTPIERMERMLRRHAETSREVE